DGIRDFHVTGVQTCALPILAAAGIVVGWPLASTLAMATVPAAHGAVFNGLLPLTTAAFAAWRTGERPSAAFWAWALAGAALVMEIGRASCRERGLVSGRGGE